MAFAAQHGAANFRLERNAVVLAAVVANDLKFLLSVGALGGLLGTALRTSLRRGHVPLIKRLLLFLGEKKSFFTLNANGFDVRHMCISLKG